MQSLQVQFGRILAFALLPVLAFSVWQAWHNFNLDTEERKRLIVETAQTSLAEINNVFNSTKSIISVGGQRLAPATCQPVIQTMLGVIPELENVVLSSAQGEIICEGRSFTNSSYATRALTEIRAENPYMFEIVESPDGRSADTLILSHAVFEGARASRIVLAVFDQQTIARLEDTSELPENVTLTLYNSKGGVVVGERGALEPEVLQRWFRSVAGKGDFSAKDNLDGGHRYLVLPTDDAGLFIVVTSPKRGLFSSAYINPLLTSLIPLLSWLFASAAIWWATSRLLLNPIRSMRKQLQAYQLSEEPTRIQFSSEPPEDIRDLANTFNDLNDVVHTQELDLKSSILEKETLLREIHHRVKNNLQVIISLLNMQERKIEDEAGLSAVRESRHRIQAIALVHKALYESDTLRFVDMDSFLRQMTSQLSRALMLDRQNIQLIINSDSPPLDSERAMPITLFIVEAVTNAVKHGVTQGGKIDIDLSREGDELEISVTDNGGPVDDAAESTSGTGKRLMAGFARQLGGRFEGGPVEGGYKVSLFCALVGEDASVET